MTARELKDTLSNANFVDELSQANNIDPRHDIVCFRRGICSVILEEINSSRNMWEVKMEGSICSNHALTFFVTYCRTILAASEEHPKHTTSWWSSVCNVM